MPAESISKQLTDLLGNNENMTSQTLKQATHLVKQFYSDKNRSDRNDNETRVVEVIWKKLLLTTSDVAIIKLKTRLFLFCAMRFITFRTQTKNHLATLDDTTLSGHKDTKLIEALLRFDDAFEPKTLFKDLGYNHSELKNKYKAKKGFFSWLRRLFHRLFPKHVLPPIKSYENWVIPNGSGTRINPSDFTDTLIIHPKPAKNEGIGDTAASANQENATDRSLAASPEPTTADTSDKAYQDFLNASSSEDEDYQADPKHRFTASLFQPDSPTGTPGTSFQPMISLDTSEKPVGQSTPLNPNN